MEATDEYRKCLVMCRNKVSREQKTVQPRMSAPQDTEHSTENSVSEAPTQEDPLGYPGLAAWCWVDGNSGSVFLCQDRAGRQVIKECDVSTCKEIHTL